MRTIPDAAYFFAADFSVLIMGHVMCDTVRKSDLPESGPELPRVVRSVLKGGKNVDGREIRIIAVDFDGTLCTDCYPAIGAPNLPLIGLLKEVRKQGRQIILWTCRCGVPLGEALAWCGRFGLEFDAVNENVREIIERYGTESRKISADLYIDDKACGPWGGAQEWRDV